LRLQLWDVYAMPRNPNGDAWDGLPSGAGALVCRAAATAVTNAVRTYLKGQLPGSGDLFDRLVRERVQSAIAEQCGLAVNWLEARYEGPDMFALGGEGASTIWQTPAVQDRWQASLRTTAQGRSAEWSMPCGATTASVLTMTDEDLAVDDAMGRTQFSLSELTPEMICGGRVLLNPFQGIASTVLRVQVDGTGQNCEGLIPTMMEQVTLPDDANVPTVVPHSPPTGRVNTP
jgi:hypothetical protein